jgi:hypothetical protein
MKTAIKIAIAGAALCALATDAFAYTLSGTIPPGRRPVVLHLHQPLPAGMTILTLSAPPVNAGVPYALGYCIGPASNPCGLPSDWTVNVPAGQSVMQIVPTSIFAGKVFVVGQGTRKPVPYKVDVNN